mmetsp:Transcript_13960/g.45569  ORF Transcript_13960/g.45569 Transcript_13960/m.45569 type:complete len:105 (-) Transcript_13960:78-392(-)
MHRRVCFEKSATWQINPKMIRGRGHLAALLLWLLGSVASGFAPVARLGSAPQLQGMRSTVVLSTAPQPSEGAVSDESAVSVEDEEDECEIDLETMRPANPEKCG